MATKKSTALTTQDILVIEKDQIEVQPALYSIEQAEGQPKKFVITSKFLKEAQATASEIGGLIVTATQKRQMAFNLASVFNAYKKATGYTFLKFVQEFFDSTCPATYGKPGTPARQQVDSNKMANGVRVLIDNGNKLIEKMERNARLLAQGINPEDWEEANKREANKRAEELAGKKDKQMQVWIDCIVQFETYGINHETLEDFVIDVLKKRSTETGKITTEGERILTLLENEVLKARGQQIEHPKPETKPDTMTLLKEGIENKDVPAMKAAAGIVTAPGHYGNAPTKDTKKKKKSA